MTTKTSGEFTGTMGQLERLARRHGGTIKWEPHFKGYRTQPLYVDGAGTVYAQSPESRKFTMIVGQCQLLPIQLGGTK